MIRQSSTNTAVARGDGLDVFFVYGNGWWGYREARGWAGTTTWKG